MSITLDSVQIEPSFLYVGFGEVLHAALASLWRRKLLVGAIVATALALGIIAVFVIPPSYTPEAYIRGGFVFSNAVAKDADTKSGPFIALDLMRVIETQKSLLQSHDLARRVVRQVGLEQLRSEVRERHWLPDNFHGSAANIHEDPTDRAATMLLSRLSVTSDQLRTYRITVSYTGKDSALAVIITNAFVAEFLRSCKLQMLSQQRSSAEASLSRQLAMFGDKHPRVAQAKMRLVATDNLLKEQLSEAPEALLQAAGENITKAIAAPSSPKPRFVISLLILSVSWSVSQLLFGSSEADGRKYFLATLDPRLRPCNNPSTAIKLDSCAGLMINFSELTSIRCWPRCRSPLHLTRSQMSDGSRSFYFSNANCHYNSIGFSTVAGCPVLINSDSSIFDAEPLHVIVFDPNAQPALVGVGDGPALRNSRAVQLPRPAVAGACFEFAQPAAGCVRLELVDV